MLVIRKEQIEQFRNSIRQRERKRIAKNLRIAYSDLLSSTSDAKLDEILIEGWQQAYEYFDLFDVDLIEQYILQVIQLGLKPEEWAKDQRVIESMKPTNVPATLRIESLKIAVKREKE